MGVKRKLWERVLPSKPCTAPDGHGCVDVLRAGHTIPTASFCPHCGAGWQIVMHTTVVYWVPGETTAP